MTELTKFQRELLNAAEEIVNWAAHISMSRERLEKAEAKFRALVERCVDKETKITRIENCTRYDNPESPFKEDADSE